LEQFSSAKAIELNVSRKEAEEIANQWEVMEMHNILSALKPKSFREGKQQLEYCISIGKEIKQRVQMRS